MFFNESLKGFLLQKKKKQQLKDSFVESEPEDAGLCQLLDRIFQTNTKLTDQMVLPNHQLQKKLDMAAVYAAVDKMNNRRLNNQVKYIYI
jgi:hypothetical protein